MGVRQIKKCCGTCKFYKFDQDNDDYCDHPKMSEGFYGCHYHIDAGHVCNFWKKESVGK